MTKTSSKRMITLVILAALLMGVCGFFLSACKEKPAGTSSTNGSGISALMMYLTFEEALLSSTDVVVARYIGNRPFGETLTEYEFMVTDRVLGNAASRIFVYVADSNNTIIGYDAPLGYNEAKLSFKSGTDYLLVLDRLWQADAKTHEDGYLFISSLIINLDNPSESTMYNDPLYVHATKLDFRKNLSRETILAFVRAYTANNTPGRDHIRSSNIEDIIGGSPYVLVVEIGKPYRLVDEQVTRDWMETDIYYCTVVQTLKGDIKVGYELTMVFFADTVKPGERRIIAVERLDEGDTWFIMTSKKSVYDMTYLDEITRLTKK